MSTDPNLNESGRVNLGDIAELEKNPSLILDATGQAAKVATTEDKTAEQVAKDMAEKVFRADGVAWHLDEESTEAHGVDMFFPRIAIKGIAEKFGVSRPDKQFMPDERNMFMQAFMNDCGLYLFGIEPFIEHVSAEHGVVFEPNPAWANLPVFQPESSDE